MKKHTYTMLLAGLAALSSSNAQEIFKDWSLVDLPSSALDSASSSPSSQSSPSFVSTPQVSSPKDTAAAPVATTLIGGKEDGGSASRPSYEGRTRSYSRPKPSTSGSSSSTTSSKDGSAKNAEVVYDEPADTAADLRFTLEAGYHSRYFYHGLDQVESASFAADEGDIGVGILGVSATWQGFFLSYKYAFAESKTNPRFDPDPDRLERYTENILEAGYNIGILPQGWLDLTASYQHIFFGDDQFWGQDAQGRIMVKASVNRFQWFRPSVAYYKFEGHEGFVNGILDGEQLIAQIEGGGSIFETGPVTFGFTYYALAAYDNEYNGSGNDFSEVDYYQAGVSFPIAYRGLTVSPSVHWLSPENQGITQDQLWWGIQASYTF